MANLKFLDVTIPNIWRDPKIIKVGHVRGVYSMGGMTHVASLKFQGGEEKIA